MKRFFLTLLVMSATLLATAQDVIFLSESDSIVAKVITVGSSEITYQKWTNLQGPVYSMAINQIAAIRYANGTYDFFTNKPAAVVVNTTNVPALTRSGNTYMYGNLVMNKDAYGKWLNEQNCPSAYQQFSSGLHTAMGGWFMMVLGLGLDLGSIIIGVTDKSRSVSPAAVGLGIAGGCLEIACIPTLCVGYSKMHRSVDIYNASCKTTASVQKYWAIQTSSNGLGLAYHF